MQAVRHKTRADGRERALCNGKNNTCPSEAKSGGMCIGCKNGTSKTVFENRAEGEIFTDDNGNRYTHIGGQSRKLCTGNNNTCESIAKKGGLCSGHIAGTKRYSNTGLVKGQTVLRDDIWYVYDGKQCRKKCLTADCSSVAKKTGRCSKHTI